MKKRILGWLNNPLESKALLGAIRRVFNKEGTADG